MKWFFSLLNKFACYFWVPFAISPVFGISHENFETSSGRLAENSLELIEGWHVPVGKAFFSAEDSHRGSQSLKLGLNAPLVSQIVRDLPGDKSVLYTDFYMKPMVHPSMISETINLEGAVIAFNSAGNQQAEVFLLDEESSQDLNFIPTGVLFPLNTENQSSDFIRITVRKDFTSEGRWSVWLNEKLVAINLKFEKSSHSSRQAVLFGNELGGSYIDDFTISAMPIYKSDWDGDSYDDVLEIEQGSDPFDMSSTPLKNIQPFFDTDLDGMGDSWEVQYFGNLNQSSTSDFDGDGLLDAQEFEMGRIPTTVDYGNHFLYVDNLYGKDSNDGKSSRHLDSSIGPVKSFKEAVSKANEGDTLIVLLGRGDYPHFPKFTEKSLRIRFIKTVRIRTQ
tara:strand:+ start:242 stop:1417 length:1176 start_codon:yes stop_codon:yes gene_type:complete